MPEDQLNHLEDENAGQDPVETQEKPVDTETFSKDYVEKLRKENAKYRTGKKTVEDQVAKLIADQQKIKAKLGVTDEEEDPLTRIEKLNKENRELKIGSFVSKKIRTSGLDETLTMALLKSSEFFSELDLDDPSAEQKIKDELVKLEKKHPQLKGSSAPIRTGSDFNESRNKTGSDMDAIIRRSAGF